MQNSDSFQNQKRSKRPLIIASAFVGILFLFVVVMSFFGDKREPVNQNGTEQTSENPEATPPVTIPFPGGTTITAKNLPNIDVLSWSEAPKPSFTPSTSAVYKFKQNFTFEEVRVMALKLNAASTIKKQYNAVLAYQDTSDGTKSFLTFDTSNGQFTYVSTAGVTLPGAGSNSLTMEEKVYQFLRDINLYDPTLKVTAQYKKRSNPGITYVEVHRDWQAAGLPIINSIGLLNLPETQTLSSLTLSTNVQNAIDDKDIYQTTDRKDGKARQNDFNTLTLAIATETSLVTGIQSNMRFLQSAASESTPVISFNDAVQKLQTKHYDLFLTSPIGGGDAPWDSIYPTDQITAQKVDIAESYVAYIEHPGSAKQGELMPYYIFRGTANLNSGYKVRFVSTVPATAGNTQSSLFGVKAVYAQDDTTQKQGTFEPNLTPGAPGSVTSAFPPSVNKAQDPTRDDTGACVPSVNELSPVYSVGGLKYGWSNYRVWQGKRSTTSNGFWYYIPEPGQTTTILQNNLDLILNTIRALSTSETIDQTGLELTATPAQSMPETPDNDTAQKQGTFNIDPQQTSGTTPPPANLQVRKENKVVLDLQNINDYCPVRVTGASPSLFIYDATGTAYQVNSGAELTYADPATTVNSGWNLTTGNDGTISANGVLRDYLYYEYVPVTFARPTHGWNISKEHVAEFARTVIARGLGLNSAETDRLVYELRHASAAIQGKALFVAPIDQKEINMKLPLAVAPNPSRLYRFHFYVSGTTEKGVTAPTLTPVMRSGSLMIELGSYSN